MYYDSFEARRWMEAGCLEPPEAHGLASWDLIPWEIEEKARKEYWQYQRQQEALRQEELNRQRQLEWKISHSMELFMEKPDLCVYDPAGSISSGALYNCYRQWCLGEEIPCQPPRAFYLHVKKNASKYRLVYTGSIQSRDGRRVRGFYGIRLLPSERLGTDKADTGVGETQTRKHLSRPS